MDPQGSVRKRKFPFVGEDFDEDLRLKLSLSSGSSPLPPPTPVQLALQHDEVVFQPPLSLPHQLSLPPQSLDPSPTPQTIYKQQYAPQRTVRTRRSPQNDTIPPPYPWATNRKATVHSLEYLRANNYNKIFGEVQCKKCNTRSTYEFDLEEKFKKVADYICRNKESMYHRAPKSWLSPDLPACNHCGQLNCLKPVMPKSKEEINWLFLLLGQMLGFCTLEQLKYFCQHTKNHRTGAKDRVLFLTFLGLCKQLDPTGPFDLDPRGAFDC